MKNLEKHINNLINDTNQAILISNVNTNDFLYKVIIPADIDKKELLIIGNSYPLWFTKLQIISKKNPNIVLLIKDIDLIPENEQLKFLGLLKYKVISGFELPKNTHIVLTCKNLEVISKDIKSYCLIIDGGNV